MVFNPSNDPNNLSQNLEQTLSRIENLISSENKKLVNLKQVVDNIATRKTADRSLEAYVKSLLGILEANRNIGSQSKEIAARIKPIVGAISTAFDGINVERLVTILQQIKFAGSKAGANLANKLDTLRSNIETMLDIKDIKTSDIIHLSGHSSKINAAARLKKEIQEMPEGEERKAALKEWHKTYGADVGFVRAAVKGPREAERFVSERERVTQTSSAGLTNLAKSIGDSGFKFDKSSKIFHDAVKSGAGKGGITGILGSIGRAEALAKKGIPMSFGNKIGSVVAGQVAEKVLPSMGIGRLAMGFGLPGMAAAGVATLAYKLFNESRLQSAMTVSPAIVGGGSMASAGGIQSAILSGSSRARSKLMFTGRADEILKNTYDVLATLGERSGTTAKTFDKLTYDISMAQAAGEAYGISAKESAGWMKSYIRSTGNMDKSYESFSKFLRLTNRSGQSFEEASMGIGEMSDLSRHFGRLGADLAVTRLQSVMSGPAGSIQKIQAAEAIRGVATSGLPRLMGLSYAAYGAGGPTTLHNVLKSGGDIMGLSQDMISNIVKDKILPSLSGARNSSEKQMILAQAVSQLYGKQELATAMLSEPKLFESLTKRGMTPERLSDWVKENADKYDPAKIGIEKMDKQIDVLQNILSAMQQFFKQIAMLPLMQSIGGMNRNAFVDYNVSRQDRLRNTKSII